MVNSTCTKIAMRLREKQAGAQPFFGKEARNSMKKQNLTAPFEVNELEKIDKPIMLTGVRINSKAKAPIFISYNEGKAIIYDRECTFTRNEQGLTLIITKEVGA